jgi:Flp pilus assembly protein TadB
VKRRYLFVVATLAALLTLAAMTWLGRDEPKHCSDHGIVSLQRAGTAARAQELISCWQQARVGDEQSYLERMRRVQQLDWLFPLFYGSALLLGCYFLGDRLRGQSLWRGLGVIGIAAAVVDYAENVYVNRMLDGTGEIAANAAWASNLAAIKFALALPVMLILLLGLAAWAAQKRFARGERAPR